MIRLDKYDNSDFSRGASRLKEILWVISKNLFFLSPWPYPSNFKVFLLRLFGAKVGKKIIIRPRVNITFPWRVEIGDHVWIGEEVILLSLDHIKIGSNVCISQRAFLCTGSHDFKQETFDLVTKPITVEAHSWIAAQAFIKPGTKIKSGQFIKANSVF